MQRFTSSWIDRGELLSAGSAIALLVLMFAFAWFGVDLPPGQRDGAERTTSENAWHGLTVVRWVMLLAVVVALGAALLHVSQRKHGEQTDTGVAVALIGAATAVLLTVRVLIDLPDPAGVVDQKLGAYLGMLSACGIAIGGYETLRERRLRARVLRRRAAEAGASATASAGTTAGAPPPAAEAER